MATNAVTNAITNGGAVSNLATNTAAAQEAVITNTDAIGRLARWMSEDTISFFGKSFWGNTIGNYVLALAIFILLIFVIFIFNVILVKKLMALAKRSDTMLDDILVKLIKKNTFPLLYFGAFYLASRSLYLSETVHKVLNIIGVILLTVFVIQFVSTVARYSIERYIQRKDADPKRRKTIRSLMPSLNVVIWLIGAIFMLANLGFDISAVVAGLGIGGIAVALAAQSLLGDFFSYFSILFDRPFELGDFIILGEYMGTIEHIGIKTTRIRSLSGEQIVMANTDLTGSRIRNYKRMPTRRIEFGFGVLYETPIEQIKVIPDIVKAAVEAQENVTFDRAHFFSFGGSSLDFKVVYIIGSGDYNVYMDIQQAINLYLFEEFAKRGIEFAYPTQTVYLNKVEEG